MPVGVFDVHAAMIQRIKALVPGFALVDSPSIVMSEGDVLKKLPGCYVFPGPAKPTLDTNKGQRDLMEAQDWIVQITIDYPNASSAQPETEMGQLIYQVISALNRWKPVSTHGKLTYAERSAVDYEEGYASVRLRFTYLMPLTNIQLVG